MKHKRFIAMLLSTVMLLGVFSFNFSVGAATSADSENLKLKSATLGGVPVTETTLDSDNTATTSHQALTVTLGTGVATTNINLVLTTSGAALGATSGSAIVVQSGQAAPNDDSIYNNKEKSAIDGTYTEIIPNISDGDIIYVRTRRGNESRYYAIAVTVTPAPIKTIMVGSQSGTIVAGIAGSAEFNVDFVGFSTASPSISWSSGSAPTGVSTSWDVSSGSGSAPTGITKKLIVTADATVTQGSYEFTVSDGGVSNTGTLLVSPGNTKLITITVDQAQDHIVANIGGKAVYNATTANIANGTAITTEWVATGGTILSDAPTGLTIASSSVSSSDGKSGTATLTVNATNEVQSGKYYFKATVDTVSAVAEINVKESYLLTYNGNGATGGAVPAEPMYYEINTKAPVLGNTKNLVKTGYVFKGWSEDQQAKNPTDYSQDGIDMDAKKTLYAVWVEASEAVYTLYTNDVLVDKHVVDIEGANQLPGITASPGNKYFDLYVEEMNGRTIAFDSNQTLGAVKKSVSHNSKRYTVIRVTYDNADPYAYDNALVNITVSNAHGDKNTYPIRVTRNPSTPLADEPFKLSIDNGPATSPTAIRISKSTSEPRTYTASVANRVQSVNLEIDRDNYNGELTIYKKVGTAINKIAELTAGVSETILDNLSVGANAFVIELNASGTSTPTSTPSLTYNLTITRASRSDDPGSTGGGSTGGSGSGGSGGGGGGGGSSTTTPTTTTPTTTPSPTNTAAQNQAAVERLLESGAPVVIALSATNDTVTLNTATIAALIEAGEPLTITQSGIQFTISPEVLASLGATSGNVQISIAPLSSDVVAELLAAAEEAGGGVITLAAGVLDINLSVSGRDVTEFEQPLEVTLEVDPDELSDSQLDRLSGVRIGSNGRINRLGGSFNRRSGQFRFFTSKLSMYSVMVAEDLVSLYMTLNGSDYILNNQRHTLDVAPVIVDSRTLVPVRLIAESFGADVGWDDSTKTVSIQLEGKTLNLTIGQLVSGLDVPPMIMNDRTMVPLRYISEYFEANVIYDDSTRSISIYR